MWYLIWILGVGVATFLCVTTATWHDCDCHKTKAKPEN